MKKLLLVFLLLSGVSIYSQTNPEDKQTTKEDLEKELKTELNKNPQDSKKVEELIKKIAVINKKSNVLTVIYDFETQAYTSNQLKPKHKQPIVFKIDNINKIANKVEITSNDVKINDDFLNGDEKKVASLIAEDKPKEEIKATALNVNLEVSEEVKRGNNKKNIEEKFNPASGIKEKSDYIVQLSGEIKALENKIQLNSNLLDQKQKILNDYQIKKADEQKKGELADSQIIANYSSTITTIGNEILTLENNILVEQSTLVNKKNENIDKKNELIKLSDDLGKFTIKTNSLLAKYNCVYGKIKDINKINSAYNNFIDYIINPSLNFNQYNNDSEGICSILKTDKRNGYYSVVSIFDEAYADFIQEYNFFHNDELFYTINKLDESYAKLVKTQIETLKRDVEALYLLVDVTGLRKKLNNVEIINNVLSKKKAFTVVSNPVQPLEDYIEFKVKIKQNNELGSSIIKENDKDFTYMEYVRQGVRWDVSVGPVFDFGIKNQEYEIKKVKDATFQIVENNTSKYKPTIAAMLHTSFRSNSMFAFGFSLGVSINVVDLNFNSFFPGVSALIGKREKIVFTVGPAFKRVNQIKSIYKNDADRILAAEIQIKDITTEQFRIGYFFGITYNLTSKQVSKIKKI
ncbi:hypothetical protein DNC80_01225 [Flavobacterium sp. SOK18b]|uniref:hypothetical protein n=1 Tax=Flavobacterium sp. SOK18b TaxID=797900 RepID=UPI0015FC6028|nr:hypothetical protein [Flavobacterium sp. SOK18b]MBB1192291.1 hypothetical protein [Flavobacterium sp. SOK18b]